MRTGRSLHLHPSVRSSQARSPTSVWTQLHNWRQPNAKKKCTSSKLELTASLTKELRAALIQTWYRKSNRIQETCLINLLLLKRYQRLKQGVAYAVDRHNVAITTEINLKIIKYYRFSARNLYAKMIKIQIYTHV